jgi:hypothetical protein
MHQGQFKLKNAHKYLGDPTNIHYRSSWEFSVMMWCDTNPSVCKWSSEELVIPYLCPTDNQWHRYFIDFTITLNDGRTFWIELKPEKYTRPPESKGSTKSAKKRYITEVYQYVKNQAKWKTASAAANKQGVEFQIWTENSLKTLGIKILGK